jgi:hypothetical protein
MAGDNPSSPLYRNIYNLIQGFDASDYILFNQISLNVFHKPGNHFENII